MEGVFFHLMTETQQGLSGFCSVTLSHWKRRSQRSNVPSAFIFSDQAIQGKFAVDLFLM
jgi:hypothetical protein